VGHTLYNLACLQLDNENPHGAAFYMKETLAIYEVAFGPDHQLTEDVAKQLAILDEGIARRSDEDPGSSGGGHDGDGSPGSGVGGSGGGSGALDSPSDPAAAAAYEAARRGQADAEAAAEKAYAEAEAREKAYYAHQGLSPGSLGGGEVGDDDESLVSDFEDVGDGGGGEDGGKGEEEEKEEENGDDGVEAGANAERGRGNHTRYQT